MAEPKDAGIEAELLAAGEAYEALFVPALFRPWVARAVAAAGIAPGQCVLDLGCGTGALTRVLADAVGVGGQVIGVDPAPGMLAVARRIAPSVDWRLEGAERLSLAAESCDRVLCQFGAMFFADRTAAVAEVRRVLRPDGEALFLVWDTLQNNPVYGQMTELFQRRFGPAAGEAMGMPFSLGEADVLSSVFSEAGFSVSVTTAQETAVFPNIRALIEAELFGWLPMFDIEIDPQLGERAIEEAAASLAAFVDSDGKARFPTSAHLIHARR